MPTNDPDRQYDVKTLMQETMGHKQGLERRAYMPEHFTSLVQKSLPATIPLRYG